MSWPPIGYHLEACGLVDQNIGKTVTCERWKGHPGNHVGWLDSGEYHGWSDLKECRHCHKLIDESKKTPGRYWHADTGDYDCHVGATP